MNKKRRGIFLAILSLSLFAQCSSKNNSSDQKNNSPDQTLIGPEGGTLTSEDGRLSVVIPPMALDKKINITIEKVSNVPEAILGSAYEIGPTGLAFLKSVRLGFLYRDDQESMADDKAALALSMETLVDGSWVSLPSRLNDLGEKRLWALTSHFSRYGIFRRWGPQQDKLARQGIAASCQCNASLWASCCMQAGGTPANDASWCNCNDALSGNSLWACYEKATGIKFANGAYRQCCEQAGGDFLGTVNLDSTLFRSCAGISMAFDLAGFDDCYRQIPPDESNWPQPCMSIQKGDGSISPVKDGGSSFDHGVTTDGGAAHDRGMIAEGGATSDQGVAKEGGSVKDGQGPKEGGPPYVNISGSWSGGWIASGYGAGTWNVTLSQDAIGNITGTGALTNTGCSTQLTVTGTVSGLTVSIGFASVPSCPGVSYSGTIDPAGNAMQGTFTVSGLPISGTWQGARNECQAHLAGPWSGSWSSSLGGYGGWNANLTVSKAGLLSGTGAITGIPDLPGCTGQTVAITGTVAGCDIRFGFVAASGCPEVDYNGMLISNGGSMSGEWNIPTVGIGGTWSGTPLTQ